MSYFVWAKTDSLVMWCEHFQFHLLSLKDLLPASGTILAQTNRKRHSVNVNIMQFLDVVKHQIRKTHFLIVSKKKYIKRINLKKSFVFFKFWWKGKRKYFLWKQNEILNSLKFIWISKLRAFSYKSLFWCFVSGFKVSFWGRALHSP